MYLKELLGYNTFIKNDKEINILVIIFIFQQCTLF